MSRMSNMKKFLILCFFSLLMLCLFGPHIASASPTTDKAYCESLDPSVDRKACMIEQRNARADKNLSTNSNNFEKNAVQRCQPFKDDIERLACYDRVTKGKKAGTVSSGGTITEHREVIIVK